MQDKDTITKYTHYTVHKITQINIWEITGKEQNKDYCYNKNNFIEKAQRMA